MADILKTVSNPLGTLIFKETAANATTVANVFNKTAAQMFCVKLDNIPGGIAFASGNYTHLAVTTTQGTAGNSAPTGTVSVTLIGT